MTLSRTTLADLRLAGMALVMVFAGAYAVKLGISPVYVAVLLGAVLLFLTSLAERHGQSLAFWVAACLVMGGLGWMLLFQLMVQGSGVPNVINLVMGPLVLGVMVTCGQGIRRAQYEAIARWHIHLSLLIIGVECLYRLAHPDYSYLNELTGMEGEDLAFYAYKFNSFMYQDSNFVGLQLVVLVGFVLALTREGVKFGAFIHLAMLVLTAMTLSRASFVTVVFLYGLHFFWRARLLMKLLCVLLGVGVAIAVFLHIQNDGSFASKFDVLQRFFEHLHRASWMDVLVGVGAGKAAGTLGMGAHNILVTYVLELGVLGALAFALFWLWMLRLVPLALFMLAGLWVNGFSLTSYAVPYLYASIAMLWLLGRTRHEQG